MKKTLQEKLQARQVKLPNGLLYAILMLVVKILNGKIHTSFRFKADPRKDKKPFILISNHASRVDYQFTGPACFPNKLNYVVGYNEFVRFPVCLILKLMQAIPKKNFTPDLHCMRQMRSVIRQGGNLCIMPEGMSSITGMAQPVMIGTGKFLKMMGVTVYYAKGSGGYLTYTKHCLDERAGRVEVTVDRMFTAEELNSLTPQEIENTMNRLLAHDDYIWNKQAQVRFDGKGQMAKALDTLLYLCPKCGALHQMACSGNEMRCTACGNTVALDECYNLHPVGEGSDCPALVSDWVLLERKKAEEDVKDPNFTYSGHVRVGKLPQYKYLKGNNTSVICGEGELRLDRAGLHFAGTVEGKPYSFHLTTEQVPTFGMCTDISRFYTFVDGEFVEFYPDRRDVLRWDHLTEEMHRINGGKWQNTPYRHCD